MSDRKTYSLSSRAVRTRSILRNTYLWMTGGLTLSPGAVALNGTTLSLIFLAYTETSIPTLM
ncbi:hypothetical protein ES708_20013 [subsurface metagenome]